MPDDLLQTDPEAEQLTAEGAQPPGDGAETGADAEQGATGDEPQTEGATDGDAADEDAGLVITLGDEEQPEVDPATETPPIRQMRQQLREVTRALRDAEKRLKEREAAPQAQAAADDPGERPKLADFDFDEDKFAEALEGWTAKRAAADAKKREREEAVAKQQEAWAQRVQTYQASAKALKVPDFEDAESTVQGALSVMQQSLLLKAKKPEILVYALGKSPKRLKELAAIADPVDFVFAVADLQKEIKVQPRKQPPNPETRVRSDIAGKAAVDNPLDRLIAEAMKAGDMTKVRQYQREKRQKQAA